MPDPLEFSGQIASEGFASGNIWHARQTSAPLYDPQPTPQADIAALNDAISMAIEQTKVMMQDADGDAVDILEFQLAMLEDNTFPESAATLILSGLNADLAWRETLLEEMSDYKASDDEYFRARAADLKDLHDRVLAFLTGVKIEPIPPGVIYLGNDISPSLFLSHDWSGGGVALMAGSVTGHVAMLARQRGIPAIVGLGMVAVNDGEPALIDARKRLLISNPNEQTVAEFVRANKEHAAAGKLAQEFADKPAKTQDGTPITVLVNIADPSETEEIAIDTVDGVGLMRTEFLFGRSLALPSEEIQFAAYRRVLTWAGDKPVTIRTVDAGGDKPVENFTEDEANPFLGMRGIRLALKKQDVFRVQIRALLRAGCFGNLKVMLPMIATPKELEDTRKLFDEEAQALANEGAEYKTPELGIMVEVPAVAILPEQFAGASFLSIGSNDLTQYVMATSRDSAQLSYLAQVDNPAVLSLIERVAKFGGESGKEVSLCGDAASDPTLVPSLLNAGLRTLSVAAIKVGAVKSAIAKIDLQTQDQAS